jgi:hypothetical protein
MKSKFKTRVSLQNVFDNKPNVSVWYKVNCSCGSDDCGTLIEVEYDKEMNDFIFMHFYSDLTNDFWQKEDGFLGWVKCITTRIKKSIILLFTGRLEMSEEFCLQGEDHITSFIEAMQEGLEFAKEGKRKQDEEIEKMKNE